MIEVHIPELVVWIGVAYLLISAGLNATNIWMKWKIRTINATLENVMREIKKKNRDD